MNLRMAVYLSCDIAIIDPYGSLLVMIDKAGWDVAFGDAVASKQSERELNWST
jgi:hypothetical protein